ncbi:hypothetical protein ACM39_02585 [Chryseobacterium sp. FH2]|uniref:hypothetical protein n=1 Tax=Chryseobacterium sp. FH2 TaxID=1674291 RepID=UPI00065AA320|nr:hypothetical protein [Chryseobacterium sp. FH2]KMQ69945.1 hypothetical protein ACM39_02585 [Chryseobacterium sp. FH2]
MLRLKSKITIEGERTWIFDAVNNCSIVQDITSLTDTCELTLPKKIVWQGLVNDNFKTPLKRGDKVTVELGYDEELKTRFTGFIKTVDAKTPVVIKCEDSMFLLKQKKVEPRAFKTALLKEVMDHILKDTGIDFKLVDDTLKVGNYRISKSTIADELQELKEKYMLNSYFRNIEGKNVLYVGLIYPLDNREKYRFVYGKNIISENFEYQDKEEIKAKVEAMSFDSKHKKTEVELGDKDGDVIKIRIDGLSEAELKKYAQESLDRYKQGGLKGSFETFGQPEVNTCDMVEIFPSEEKSGVYLIKKNEISFGINGYRQKIELGQPLSP